VTREKLPQLEALLALMREL